MMLFRKCVSGVRAVALAAVVTGLVPVWQSARAEAQVSVGISVNFAPPALPVYEQPLCPGDGYIWNPGYWAWDPDYQDYYWVPGTWVLAPQPGYLWTPPWWGWNGIAFVFHDGYWGPRIGFYGGINYGYGYPGRGYYGGRWERDRFYYNRNVNNINVTQIHNVYNKTVINNVNVTRVSYNGGDGGVRERANRQEEAAFRERHVAAVAAQQQHIQEARADRALRASDNRGKPPIAATDRPGQFRGNVVPAKEGRYNPPANRAGGNRGENARPENNVNRAPQPNRNETRNARNDRPPNARGAENNRPTYVHPNEVPKANRPERPPSSGNAKADQKYNQRSDNLYKKQEQERQNLEKKQEQQHARAEQQRANDSGRQQMEKQHQQQTQKMEQRQQQQQQKMQREAPKPKPQPQPKQQQPKQQGDKPHGKGR